MYTQRSLSQAEKLSDKFRIIISIKILFKDIKLFGQSDSYYVLQVKHQGGGGEKRYISIKLLGALIPIS